MCYKGHSCQWPLRAPLKICDTNDVHKESAVGRRYHFLLQPIKFSLEHLSALSYIDQF